MENENNLCMVGKIRTKEKCSVCGKKFENIVWALIYKEHFTSPTRYYIDLYWKGKQRKIYSDNDGRILNNFELANRVLAEIRQKIDKHRFDPADYVAKNYIALQFDSYVRKWVSRCEELHKRGEIALKTVINYKFMTEKYFIPFFKSVDIRDIRSGDIDDFYLSLSQELSISTIDNIFRVFHSIFGYAKKRRDIKEIPDFPKIREGRRENGMARRWYTRANN